MLHVQTWALYGACCAVGTFGRVLECWDRKLKDYVAVKIVRNVDKYRHAAMIEVGVLLVAACAVSGARDDAMVLMGQQACDSRPSLVECVGHIALPVHTRVALSGCAMYCLGSSSALTWASLTDLLVGVSCLLRVQLEVLNTLEMNDPKSTRCDSVLCSA